MSYFYSKKEEEKKKGHHTVENYHIGKQVTLVLKTTYKKLFPEIPQQGPWEGIFGYFTQKGP